MNFKNASCLTLSLLILSGCTLGPDFKKPSFGFADKSWISEKEKSEEYIAFSEIEEAWWQQLNDPMLDALIAKAINENLDIKIAQKNLERADALITQSRSGLLPNMNAEGGLTRQKLSENSGIPTGPTNPRIQNVYDAGLVSNWELDIFGGTRREVAAAYARFESLENQKRDTLLLVLSEVARNYVELRGEQQRARIVKTNIKLQDQTTNLAKRRFDIGDASEFDYSRALAQLQSTKSQLPNIDGVINTLIYRLSVLTGQAPEALLSQLSNPTPLPVKPDIIKVGLRSDMLRRRPDVRAAENNLKAEVNDIGARVAELFPKFTLTGSVGYQSIGADGFISSGSQVWSIGPGISWPIFNAGRIRAQIDAEEAEAEAAAFEYERTILQALEDAEAAFTQYGQELETREQLKKAVSTRKRNVEMATKRYESGLDSLIDLIDTERELLNSELDLIQSEKNLMLKLVRLYKSLGGGWK